MKRALLVVCALAGTAHADKLGVAWTAKGCIAPFNTAATADSFVWADKTAIKRLDRKTGAAKTDWKLPAGTSYVNGVVPGAIAVWGRKQLAAIDPASGAQLWTKATATQPSVTAVGGDLAIGTQDAATHQWTVEVVDAKTGKQKWTATSSYKAQRNELWFDGGTSTVFMLVDDTKLLGFTAKGAWKVDLAGGQAHAIAGDEAVVASGSKTLVVDGTGKTAATLDVQPQQLAGFGTTVYGTDNEHEDHAFAIEARKLKWKVEIAKKSRLAGASAQGALVVEADEIARILGASNGAQVASTLVAGQPILYSPPDGAPIALACERNKTTVAFDPSAKDTKDVTVTVTGTLECTNCGAGERFDLTVGGVSATTDDKGHFSVKVTGHGVFAVKADLTHGYDHRTLRTLKLPGEKSYDLGKVSAEAPDGE